MELRFRALIRRRHDGYYTGQVLCLPNARAFEPSREAALESLRTVINQWLGWRDRGWWSRVRFYEHQELRPLTLELPQPGDAPPQPFTLSILVTREERPEGARWLVTAPGVKEFQLVLPGEAEIEPAARAALERCLGKWSPARRLRLEREGEETLEVLTVHVPGTEEDEDSSSDDEDEDSGASSASEYGGEDVLGLCGIHLTAQAASGRLPAAERREALLERMLTALSGERLSSLILVGPADAGKTALVHELARRIVGEEAPESLRGRDVWSVTASNLIAGMKYYGEWQGRAQQLVRQARHGRQILYMGDPNEILGAGRFEGSDNNLGRYLRPYMETGEVTLICECSPEAYAAEVRREPSFMQGFRRIDVAETDEPDTQAILQATARRLEEQHPVRIEGAALAAALDLTRRFMPYRAFPGKAVRFLEEMVRDTLAPGEEGEPRPLGRAEAIAGFTRATGLPAFILSDEVPLRLPEVRTYFEERLLGQPEAVDAMTDLVTVLKAGLNDPNKPLGSFFFVGPTGVGKTEMAKVLAEYLFGSRDRMLRFDMSEFASADALPRLIGSAWKRDDQGELTRRVREQPFCVVLLDELEKAHQEVFDALLGVLGEGRLTDAGGRITDFRNAIIIMTSNLAASRREMHAIGFGRGEDAPAEESAARLHTHFVKEAEGFFRPEFFNRIDRIVAFRPLTAEAMRRITRRELGKLLMREGIVRRNLLVEIDDAVIDRLVDQGFHPLYGARPLQREIERAVILPLARLLVDRPAEQRIDHRHLLRFNVREGKIHLSLVRVDTADEEGAQAEPLPDRRLEADVAAILKALQALRAECAAEDAGPGVEALRREVSLLLARTREPTFWDEPGTARETLQRVYHLERVLRRLDTLGQRAEALEERAHHLRRSRDRRGLPDLAQSVERLEAELSYLQIELAGAAAGERHDQALLRVAPVGADAAAWAGRLLQMYRAWAGRKGYECRVLETPEGERRAAGPLPPALALYVRGSNVYQFLRCEAGLHKLDQGSGEERERLLARVAVLRAPGPPGGDDGPSLERHSAPSEEAPAEESEDSAVVRTYCFGRHRYVRDPRTGARVSHVEAVLEEGQIDAFLLARLRQALSG